MLALVAGNVSYGQHFHGGGHYHVEPGHFHRHHDHYDYHPARIIYRPELHTVRGPIVFGEEDHSHDHTGSNERHVFGGFSHIDDLTMQLSQEANLLCYELHYNYQHNPGFSQTYREAYEILTTAKYLHGLEHSGNREKLRRAATELDQLFHHVESDVESWTAHHHRQVGFGGLGDKLQAVETTLHHLLDDVGVRSQFVAAPEPAESFPIGR
jgi:hypothetical protein